MAVFPNGIKEFRVHQNLLHDVDANDINAIQDEIVAMQTSLGDALNDIEEIEADVEEIVDENLMQDRDIRRNFLRFKNLREKVDWIWRGGHIHACRLMKGDFLVPSKPIGTRTPTTVNFPKPSNSADPHGMFNGIGMTARVTGWYLLIGHVRWDLSFGNKSLNEALYQGQIGIGSKEKATDRFRGVDNEVDVINNPSAILRIERGTRISLRVNHNSGAANRKIGNANLAAMLLRRL